MEAEDLLGNEYQPKRRIKGQKETEESFSFKQMLARKQRWAWFWRHNFNFKATSKPHRYHKGSQTATAATLDLLPVGRGGPPQRGQLLVVLFNSRSFAHFRRTDFTM